MFWMLDVALQYCKAIERMTEAQVNNLHQWEPLEEWEWEIVQQLHDILQVSRQSLCGSTLLLTDFVLALTKSICT